MQKKELPCTSELATTDVVHYLQNNPEFFLDNEDLLLKLKIPHKRGSAVSLVEHQVNILRERKADLKKSLSVLIGRAKENDRLFKSCRMLINLLIKSSSLDELNYNLKQGLEDFFSIDLYSLILISKRAIGDNIRIYKEKDIPPSLMTFFIANTTCGCFDQDVYEFLFPEDYLLIGSVAITPLQNGNKVGLLALGSKDGSHFREDQDTQFIDFISEIITSIIGNIS